MSSIFSFRPISLCHVTPVTAGAAGEAKYCCVWSVCENVHVFWEEPVKMMRANNVAVGRLHY